MSAQESTRRPTPARTPARTRTRTLTRALTRTLARALLLVALGALAFVLWPLPEELLARRAASSLRVLDARGDVLREVRGVDGRSVPLEGDRVPPLLRAAFIATEDQRFGAHIGIDPRAIARALRDSLRAGELVSGASTIPQQLARRLVPRERSLAGKLQEALWAMRLTLHLDDEQLLVEYLNRVPLGRGTVGVEAASDAYFAKPAGALSVAEAALLAGLAHAPAYDDPLRHPERALARRRTVLERMRRLGSLDGAVLARALDEPLDEPLARARGREQTAPHFVDAIVASLPERGLADAVVIETTLDPALQAASERIVREELTGPLAEAGVGQAAVVVLDNATGAVLAYVGSRDWGDPARLGMNDGVRARRQPGSALKPFVYGMALSRGMTPSTILPDVELTMATESGTYAPRNYDKRVHGPVRLRAALQNSYNIPAVHLAEMLGPRRVLDGLHAAGFLSLDQSPEHYGVGLVLGNGDVTLLELARAYRGLARGGVVEPVIDVRAARDGAGRSLTVAPSFAKRRFLPSATSALLTDILVDADARSPAFGLDNALDLPFPTAAKTGTSRAYVDNWTAGFTSERTVAVWAGNFDGTPMRHIAGIHGAGTIFRRVLIEAMGGIDARALVDTSGFETARICPLSGLRATPSCPGALEEHFLPGTAPVAPCASHVHARQPSPAILVDLAPRYTPWARAEGLPLAVDVNARVAAPGERTRLLSPVSGDSFVRDPGIPSGQGIPVKIAAVGVDVVEIRVGSQRHTLRAPFSTWIDAIPGAHSLSIVDPVTGVVLDVARFTVR